MRIWLCIVALFIFCSCIDSGYKEFQQSVAYWQGREVLFPKDTVFISYSRKCGERKVQLPKSKYAILCYVDSIGCMSCKLQLDKWGEFINQVDSISSNSIPFFFIFQSKEKADLIHFLKKNRI